MAVLEKHPLQDLIASKDMLIRITDEQNARSGFVPDPEANAEKVRRLMLEAGVRPEDCISTRELLAMREE